MNVIILKTKVIYLFKYYFRENKFQYYTLSFFSEGTFLREGLSAEAGDLAPPGVFSPLPCDLLGRGIHRLL